uniref:Uncharacterized protein n=1 Tax=Zosterops lateralis melanops TaxID=1220523 RepID=A0A8D2PL78_ZOSLA
MKVPKTLVLLSTNMFSKNYGGVYVGLPSDAAAMAPSQTKAAPKGTGRSWIALLLLSRDHFIS